ncbi:hypothetical protein M5689_012549 [Euphorbia peplus]|nr:hypothetical protein M5689_012549 [Euphorbia peplus]
MFGNRIPDYRNAKRGRKQFEKRNHENPVAKKMRSENQLQSHTAVVTLKRYQTHNVAIPRSFAIQAGLKHRNGTMIEYPKGRTWPIQVWKRNDNAFLSTVGLVSFKRMIYLQETFVSSTLFAESQISSLLRFIKLCNKQALNLNPG